jgi:hypothetical protein
MRQTTGRPIGRLGIGQWPPLACIRYFQLILISNIIFEHCSPDHGIHLLALVAGESGRAAGDGGEDVVAEGESHGQADDQRY